MNKERSSDIMIGEFLKNKRKELKISQHRLADMCDCHLNTISRIERGETLPTFEKVVILCRALNIDNLEIEKIYFKNK